MDSPGFDLKAFLFFIIFVAFILCIGFYLHMKILKTLKIEKTTTWEINICHSIVMICHYTFTSIFEIIAYVVPDMVDHTATEFCYLVLFLRCYGLFSILLHSLMVCMYKYIVIVHTLLVRQFGEDKLKKLIMVGYLMIPILVSISFMARSQFFALPATLVKCGLHKDNARNDTNLNESKNHGGAMERLFFCGLYDYVTIEDGFEYFIHVVNQIYCFLQTILFLGVLVNLFEAFFYKKIFSFAKR